MKKATLVMCLLASFGMAYTQPVTITVQVFNQLTEKPIDASLTWYNPESVKKLGTGKYSVLLGEGEEQPLTISRKGYFDSNVRLDYETVKANPTQEVKLQPGIPQLHISILSDETEEVVTSSIDLFTLDESSIVFSEEVEVSPYTIDLEYNEAHVLQVRSPGFFSFKDTIDFTGVYEGRVREKTIRLVPLKVGNKISLNNIHFKQNEAALTDFAKLMLVELSHVLEQQQNIAIEIGAYTDDVGTDQYNLDLSQKRAVAVKNYLLEKGAKSAQLQTKGYGEASPAVPNTSEENRSLNRRVEFKIVK